MWGQVLLLNKTSRVIALKHFTLIYINVFSTIKSKFKKWHWERHASQYGYQNFIDSYDKINTNWGLFTKVWLTWDIKYFKVWEVSKFRRQLIIMSSKVKYMVWSPGAGAVEFYDSVIKHNLKLTLTLTFFVRRNAMKNFVGNIKQQIS